MKAHIVTCDSKDRLREFVENGYVGVRPIPPKKLTERGLLSKLGTNWDIVADLKRVKPGDLIFLHADRSLYGLFAATSCFGEESDTPRVYKSKNLNIRYWTENKEYWPSDIENAYDQVRESTELCWKAGIQSVEGRYFDKPLDVMDIFRRASVGEIQTIPVRFWYDGEKTVKPMLQSEKEKIAELLTSFNSGIPSTRSVQPYDTRDLREITIDLHSYRNKVSCEKILEAYIMENITSDEGTPQAREETRKLVGDVDFFANTVYTYYTNYIDVFCQRKVDGENENMVVELKRGAPDPFPKTLEQVTDYASWIRLYMERGAHAGEKVVSIIVARTINKSYMNWKKKNPQANVRLFTYDFAEDFSYIKFEELANR